MHKDIPQQRPELFVADSYKSWETVDYYEENDSMVGGICATMMSEYVCERDILNANTGYILRERKSGIQIFIPLIRVSLNRSSALIVPQAPPHELLHLSICIFVYIITCIYIHLHAST